MAKKSGLGRGLDALIPGWQEAATPAAGDSVSLIPVANISPIRISPEKPSTASNLRTSRPLFANTASSNPSFWFPVTAATAIF